MSGTIRTDKQDALTASELRTYLSYDSETGIFIHLPRTSGSVADKQFNTRCAGRVAGGTCQKGYVLIGVQGFKYAAARLANLYMTGAWPSGEMDHIDRNPSNNSWRNLRDVTEQQNQTNKGLYKANRSGTPGVRWLSGQKKWKAGIHGAGKGIHLGVYETLNEAVIARLAAEKALGWLR